MSAPELTVYEAGQTSVTADRLNTFGQTCDNIANLRGFIGISGIQVFIRGAVTPNDGGAGAFYWDATGTGPDDGVSVIVPTGSVLGCWVRLSVVLGVANDAFGFPTTADLLSTFPNSIALTNGRVAITAGRTAQGDQGGADFYYDLSDTTSADNGGTIRVDGASRRWKYAGNDITTSLFGAVPSTPSSPIDCTTALTEAFTALGNGTSVRSVAGWYCFTTPFVAPAQVSIRGDGWSYVTTGTVFGGGAYIPASIGGTVLQTRLTGSTDVGFAFDGTSSTAGYKFDMRDMVFLGPGSGSSTLVRMGTSDSARQANNADWRNFYVGNAFVGLSLGFSQFHTFTKGRFIGNVFPVWATTSAMNVCDFFDCVTGNNLYGMYFDSNPTGVRIDGGADLTNLTQGIYMLGADSCVIENRWVENDIFNTCTSSNINATGSSGVGDITVAAVTTTISGMATWASTVNMNALGSAGTGVVVVGATNGISGGQDYGFRTPGLALVGSEVIGFSVVDQTHINVTARAQNGTSGATHTDGLPITDVGYFLVDTEIMSYYAVSTTDLKILRRGEFGTTAATHNNGSTLYKIFFDITLDQCQNCSLNNCWDFKNAILITGANFSGNALNDIAGQPGTSNVPLIIIDGTCTEPVYLNNVQRFTILDPNNLAVIDGEPKWIDFTPNLAIGGSSVGITYTSRIGRYRILGETVQFCLDMVVAGLGGLTGTATIENMPEVGFNNPAMYPSLSTAFFVSTALTGTPFATIGAGTTQLRLYQTNGTGGVALTDAAVGATSHFTVSGSYEWE